MPRITLHIACGGDTAATKLFFDNAGKSGIAYDVIGQSYYPLWNGTLSDLQRNPAFMAGRYAKDIIVVETAFTEFPGGGSPFPMSDDGQSRYLRAIDSLVLGTPDGFGKGSMWWEPTGEAYLGTSRGLFDLQLNARPALSVFDGREGQVSLGSHAAAGSQAEVPPDRSAGAWMGPFPSFPRFLPKGRPQTFFTSLGRRVPVTQ